jgi:hypothetical protein
MIGSIFPDEVQAREGYGGHDYPVVIVMDDLALHLTAEQARKVSFELSTLLGGIDNDAEATSCPCDYDKAAGVTPEIDPTFEAVIMAGPQA